MRAKTYALAAFAAVLLSGCQHPLVKLDPITFQSKIEEVADWDSLANRQVERMTLSLDGPTPVSGVLDGQRIPGPLGGRPFFIAADTSEFAQSFKPLLEKHLLQRGYTVVPVGSQGTWNIELSTETFLYHDRYDKRPVEYATFWTTLASLGTLLRDVSSVDTGVAIVATTGPVLDALHAINDRTNAEVLLILTVSDVRQLYYRNTEAFYVQPKELKRYWRNDLLFATLPISRPR